MTAIAAAFRQVARATISSRRTDQSG